MNVLDLNIAPRPRGGASGQSTRYNRDVYEQDNGGGSGSGGGGAPAGSRRKNVRSACQSCRDRKVKCDGSSPCTRCIALGVGCVYATDLDGRTSAAIKRKFDAYEQGQQFLHELLNSIRHRSDEQVGQIVSLIRANASLEEIRTCMSQQVSELRRQGKEPSPELNTLQKEFARLDRRRADSDSTASRRGILQIVRLVDEPLHRVPAHPWTDVIDDDDLVSNLVSVWLSWDYLIYNWMDPNVFVRDMQGAQLDSVYCSPFLVNCILAWACPYSDWQEARSVRGRSSKLVHKFLEEAKGLLESEIVRGPSLTLLQGLMFLFLALSLNGQDRLGYQYLVQAMDVAKQLPKALLKKSATPNTSADELVHMIDHTCWGVYNTVVATFSALMRPYSMKAPRKPRLHFKLSHHEMLWTPYPQQGDAIHSHLGELFDNLCEFSELMGSIHRFMFVDGDDDVEAADGSDNGLAQPGTKREQAIVEIYLRLVRQCADLPRHLQPIEGAPPSVCVHHLWMNAQLLSVLLFLKRDGPPSSLQIRRLAQLHSFDKALECAYICRYYMNTFSSSLASNCFTQALSMSLYILIEDAVNIGKYQQEVTDLCIMLRTMSRRWPLSMGILRMVQLKARQLQVQLPSSTDKLFEDFEAIDWEERDQEMFTLYPDPDSTMFKTEEVIDMKEFLDRMQNLEVDRKERAPE